MLGCIGHRVGKGVDAALGRRRFPSYPLPNRPRRRQRLDLVRPLVWQAREHALQLPMQAKRNLNPLRASAESLRAGIARQPMGILVEQDRMDVTTIHRAGTTALPELSRKRAHERESVFAVGYRARQRLVSRSRKRIECDFGLERTDHMPETLAFA